MTEQEEKMLKTALRWYMDMYGCRPDRNETYTTAGLNIRAMDMLQTKKTPRRC